MRSSRRRAAWLRWRQRGKGHSKRHLANVYHHDLYSPLLVAPEDVVVMCGTITFERRCYLHSYIHRPTIRHCSDDGYTPGYWGDPDPRWDRTLYRGPERNQPWPAHRGGYRNATCRGPGALWGGRSLFRRVARCCCGRRDAYGGCALRDPGFVAGLQREACPYRQGGDDRRGGHRKESRGSELFRMNIRARRAVAGRACIRPGGDRPTRWRAHDRGWKQGDRSGVWRRRGSAGSAHRIVWSRPGFRGARIEEDFSCTRP